MNPQPAVETQSKPLAGKRVVVTRARDQAGGLSARLEGLGAEVIEMPLISVAREIDKQALADVMLEMGSYDWLVFTSANGVRYFFEEFFRLFDDIRALGLIRIACVGDGTSESVESLHLRVDCKPAKATSEALAAELVATGGLDHGKVLVITGNLNRDLLVKKLEEARAIVDRLQVYSTGQADVSSLPAAAEFRRNGADAILFASSSAVQSFRAQSKALALSGGARPPLAGSIGPQTSEAMREAGIAVDIEAGRPGLDGLVEAVVGRLGGRAL